MSSSGVRAGAGGQGVRAGAGGTGVLGGGGSSPEAAPTFVSSSTASVDATSITPTLPTGWAEDDVCVGVITQSNASNIHTVPSGWNLLESATAGTHSQIIVWRRLKAGDGNPTFTYPGSVRNAAVLAVYRGVAAVDAVVASADTTITIGESISSPSLTTVSGNDLFVAFATEGWTHAPTLLTANGFTLRDSVQGNTAAAAIADQIIVSPGSTTGPEWDTISAGFIGAASVVLKAGFTPMTLTGFDHWVSGNATLGTFPNVSNLVNKTGGTNFNFTVGTQGTVSILNGHEVLNVTGGEYRWSSGRWLSDDVYDLYMVVKGAAQTRKALVSQHDGIDRNGDTLFGTGNTDNSKFMIEIFDADLSPSRGETTATVFDDTVHIVRAWSAGDGDHYAQVDGGTNELLISGVPYTPRNVQLAIASINSGSWAFDGTIAEMFLCDQVQTQTVATKAVTYLTDKWQTPPAAVEFVAAQYEASSTLETTMSIPTHEQYDRAFLTLWSAATTTPWIGPDGWENIYDQNISGNRMVIFTKLLEGGESNVTWTSSAYQAGIAIYRNAIPRPIVGEYNYDIANTLWDAPPGPFGLTTNDVEMIALATADDVDTGLTLPTGFTERLEGSNTVGSDESFHVYDRAATGTRYAGQTNVATVNPKNHAATIGVISGTFETPPIPLRTASAEATATSLNVDLTGFEDGDLMIVNVATYSATNWTNLPDGWTNVTNTASGNNRLKVMWRIKQSGDTTVTFDGWANSDSVSALIVGIPAAVFGGHSGFDYETGGLAINFNDGNPGADATLFWHTSWDAAAVGAYSADPTGDAALVAEENSDGGTNKNRQGLWFRDNGSTKTGFDYAAPGSVDVQIGFTLNIVREAVSAGQLEQAIDDLSADSYWPLRGGQANAVDDSGSLANDLTVVGTDIEFGSQPGADKHQYPLIPLLTSSGASELRAPANNAYQWYGDSEGNVDITIGFVANLANGAVGGRLASVNAVGDATPEQWHIDLTQSGGNHNIAVYQHQSGGSSFGETWNTGISADNWVLYLIRIYGEFNYPLVWANDLTNNTGSGAGAAPGHDLDPLRLLNWGTGNNSFEGVVAHFFITNEYISDGPLQTLQFAAQSDGWYS